MRFEDEQYVRLYKRDTTTWLMLTWQGRCILPLILRKLDRAGLLDLGDDGYEALAAHIQVPLEVVEEGMKSIVRRGALVIREDGLLMSPRFIEAQEAKQSDKARQKASRDRARDLAGAVEKGVKAAIAAPPEEDDTDSPNVTHRDGAVTHRDSSITPRDGTVTRGHTASQRVTLSSAEPSCAQQSSAVLGVQGAAPDAEGSASTTAAPTVDPKSRKRGRLPQTYMRADWQPTPEHAKYVRDKGLDVAAVVEDFRNHWLAEGKLGANWDARFKQNVDRILRTDWLQAKFAAPPESDPVDDPKVYGEPAPPPPELLPILQSLYRPRPMTPLEEALAPKTSEGAPVFWTPSAARAGGER